MLMIVDQIILINAKELSHYLILTFYLSTKFKFALKLDLPYQVHNIVSLMLPLN